ncbi:hypothetical protein [Streptomyces sp. NBC_01614]|uniref:hypothetical protein n=1 Tax=Streptomyces sp. NBC_01614 TaxID=2975897 RepID=UPI00386B9920
MRLGILGDLASAADRRALTARTTADAFIDSLSNPNTIRNYGSVSTRPLAEYMDILAVDDWEYDALPNGAMRAVHPAAAGEAR